MEAIIRQFTNETVDEIKSIPGGHINESFLVTGKKRYVLQRVNASLYGNALKVLGSNYLCYREACRGLAKSAAHRAPGGRNLHTDNTFEWQCPEWMQTKDGGYFHTDEAGRIWRMYEFIPGEIMTGKETETDAFALGEGLGRLHGILNTIPAGAVTGVLPHLHDLKYYYEEFRKYDFTGAMGESKAAGGGNDAKVLSAARDPELEHIIRDNIKGMLNETDPAKSIIHADAKAGNMIFREGKVVAFIDLDTMMEGSIFDDLADCMRASCVDKNAGLMEERIHALLDGYEEGAKVVLSSKEREYARANLISNRFMLGLRYYTDFVSQAGYFREEYPGQNLEKARSLLL